MSAPATDLSQVTAAILAGGLGTRLRSVIADRPKVMAEVNGKPFLEYLLAQLAGAGCRSVVLCTGHLGEQIQGRFGSRFDRVSLHYSREAQALGTAGALRLALPLLTSEPVLVMNGDSYCAADLTAYWRWYSGCQPPASLLLTEVGNASRYGSVLLDGDARVRQFREKSAAAGPGSINAGIYFLRRAALEMIAPDKMVSLEYDIFPKLVGQGLMGFVTQGRFLDIGTPEDFALAGAFFAAKSGA